MYAFCLHRQRADRRKAEPSRVAYLACMFQRLLMGGGCSLVPMLLWQLTLLPRQVEVGGQGVRLVVHLQGKLVRTSGTVKQLEATWHIECASCHTAACEGGGNGMMLVDLQEVSRAPWA